MTEFFSNIAEVLNWDVFLMGVLFLVTLAAAFLILFLPREELIEQIEKFVKKTRQTLSGVGLGLKVLGLVVMTYYAGVMVNTFCDYWIDQDALHLGLPRLAVNIGIPLATDDEIKTLTFKRVYPEFSAPSEQGIRNFYYHAKNTLWKDEQWRQYILYTQKMINISRVWVFSFFIVIVATLIRWIRWLLDLTIPRTRREATLGVGLLAISLAAYFLGLLVWADNEREIDAKIFGVYRSEHGWVTEVDGLIKEPPARLRYSIVQIGRPESLEPSGVAHRDGHLFVVDDKTNVVHVFDAETGRYQSGVVIPIVSRQREISGSHPNQKSAKFEEIAYHAEADLFYVIGAHFKKDYQVTLRFGLRPSDDRWEVVGPEEIPLAGAVSERLQEIGGKSRVEGLAVSGDPPRPVLFVGFRTSANVDGDTRLQLLRFELNGTRVVDQRRIELEHKPLMTHDEHPYHLSALTYDQPDRLLVLTSSEDDENRFHGNRIHCFDVGAVRLRKTEAPHSLQQIWESGDFVPNQKAEGLVFWKGGHRSDRLAVVFDNDFEATGQSGAILLADAATFLDWVGDDSTVSEDLVTAERP